MSNPVFEQAARFVEASTIRPIPYRRLREGMLLLAGGHYWRVSNIRCGSNCVQFVGRIIDPGDAMYRSRYDGATQAGHKDAMAFVVIEH
jgi:hypothetical protein